MIIERFDELQKNNNVYQFMRPHTAASEYVYKILLIKVSHFMAFFTRTQKRCVSQRFSYSLIDYF